MYHLRLLKARTVLYEEKRTERGWSNELGQLRQREVCGDFGERVRQFRTALGMTQAQREAISGVPHVSIASIESGMAEDVYVSTVIGFAKALRVSADDLLGLKEEQDGEQQEETTPMKTTG